MPVGRHDELAPVLVTQLHGDVARLRPIIEEARGAIVPELIEIEVLVGISVKAATKPVVAGQRCGPGRTDL